MAAVKDQNPPPAEGVVIKEKKKKLTKAEKKEIALQKSLSLQRHIFRDHLQRELKYTNKSLQRGGKEWDTMIKTIRNKELMFELEDWRKRAWRLLDRKDFHIRLLLQNVDIAEEQHDRMYSMHNALTDYLTDFCKHMIHTIKNVYDTEAFEIISVFYDEKFDREKSAERFQNYYENLMHADNLISEFTIDENKENHIEKKEDVVNDNVVRCYALRDSAINKMNKLCRQLEKVFRDLEEDTINVRPKEEFIVGMAKQKQHDVEMEKIKDASKEGIEQIAQFQIKLTQVTLECQQKEIKVMEKRQLKHLNFLHLRSKEKRYSQLTDTHIQILATESHTIIEDLKKLVEYGKHLIGIAFTCRKHQTETEKVVPWPESRKDINTVEMNKTLLDNEDTSKKTETLIDSNIILDHIGKLQNFLYRSACCENQCQILRKEKKELEKENKQYIELIKTCYEDITYQNIMKHVKSSQLLTTLNIEPRSFA